MTLSGVLGVTRLRPVLYLGHTHHAIHMDSVLTGLTGVCCHDSNYGVVDCFEVINHSFFVFLFRK